MRPDASESRRRMLRRARLVWSISQVTAPVRASYLRGGPARPSGCRDQLHPTQPGFPRSVDRSPRGLSSSMSSIGSDEARRNSTKRLTACNSLSGSWSIRSLRLSLVVTVASAITLTPGSSPGQALALSRRGRGDNGERRFCPMRLLPPPPALRALRPRPAPRPLRGLRPRPRFSERRPWRAVRPDP